MFKYGSLRHFLIKIITGIVFLSIAVILLLSLYSYDLLDPGMNKLVDESSDYQIKNIFGNFGAHLSSYSIELIGYLSYIVGFYLLLKGFKLTLGIKTKFIIIKFLFCLTGILLINLFFENLVIISFENGILSELLLAILYQYIINYVQNIVLINLIFVLFFLAGLLLILYSFSIKINFIKNILGYFKFFKYLRFLRYLFFFFKIFKYLKFSKKLSRNKLKNEPTIFKNRKNNSEPIFSLKRKTPTNLEKFKFNLPSSDLLNKSNNRNFNKREMGKIYDDASEKLEQTLQEYGVDGKIVGYKTGPIVTLFEFIPNAGVKSSKIIGLSDDIARAMSSISARISSQPGKNSLGIEIPNLKRDNVLLGDIIEEKKFLERDGALTLALGKDISGETIFADLERMPHLLIAGTTGSGKSVGINTMILSILFKFKPNECKLILIDPKMLELSIYENIPHLLTPVVTDPKKAVFALKWVVREMENRYKLMSTINVKNIDSYNSKVLSTLSSGRKIFKEVQTGIDNDTRMPILEKKEIKLEKLPYIVVVIDEMADLMMVAGKEVETLVQRLAQMARASGIHLITATQRPSVDVITGTIKANFPSRISYKVASKFDSRTILNEMGAEQLLGSGDMLLLENGGNIKRLHGGFVSENEVERVVSFIRKQATFDPKKEISLEESNLINKENNDLISNNNDELYNKAVEIVIKQQKVSTSYIQRYLQIGYNRAARIVEKMEEDGIITEANNAGKRHVLKKN